MNGIVKVLTGILGVLAVVACLATIGIIGYAYSGAGDKEEDVEVSEVSQDTQEIEPTEAPIVPTAVPEETISSDIGDILNTPAPTNKVMDLMSLSHVHDYKESTEKKATCYSAGKIKYTCEGCGDTYYVDIMSTGHVPDDWELSRKPTPEQDGLQVKKCIYCDEIIAQESIPYVDESEEETDKEEEPPHVHQYTATTEREPSCILAGLRKYSCSCGNFYTEMIPAIGHIVSDWDVVTEATTSQMGTQQRTCSVCGVVVDSRPIDKLTPSPAATESPTSTPESQSSASPGSSATPTERPTEAPTPSPSPTPEPHTHNYRSYVLKRATCTEVGVRSYVCNCGSSYAEAIELDPNNHTYRAVVIPATAATQGYTAYTCIRCNYSYFDNYTPSIGN